MQESPRFGSTPDAVASDSGPGAGLARWELAAYGVLLSYFAARITFLALRIDPFVPPDEVTHLGRVLAYARVWGVPDNTPDSYAFGLLDHSPWLYYWLMARALAFHSFGLSELAFLRLLNGAMGIATAVTGITWMRLWCGSATARVLFAVLLTNTLMFTAISASVSYDNLANCLAAMALLAFTRFRLRRSADSLVAGLALLSAGALVKQSLLPLALLFVLLLALREGRLRLPITVPGHRLRMLALGGVALLLAGFALSLYGQNLLRYGKLTPSFDQVVGEHAAMQNRVFARGRILERYQSGAISGAEARSLAARIRHPKDRNDTLFLLRAAKRPESSVLGRLAYVPEWCRLMLASSAGYAGHRHTAKSTPWMRLYFAVYGLAAALGAWGTLRRRQTGPANGHPVIVDSLVLTVGYALTLMWLVHYPAYQMSRYIELALQGRYLFPVLVPICGLLATGLIAPLPARVRPWLAAAVAGLYLYGDLPWLLQQIDASWLMPGPG